MSKPESRTNLQQNETGLSAGGERSRTGERKAGAEAVVESAASVATWSLRQWKRQAAFAAKLCNR